VLPWLALLLLFLPQRNRPAAAWLVWPALFAGLGLGVVLPRLINLIAGQTDDIFGEAARGLAFGLATVWLLSPYLARQHRFLTFLGILVSLGISSEIAFAFAQDWGNSDSETFFSGVAIVVCALILSLGLSFAGLLCRKRYGAARLALWCAFCILAATLVVMVPFLVWAEIVSRGSVMLGELLGGILILAAVNYLLLLPFLALSWISGFYRERLKILLRLGSGEIPPVIASAHGAEVFAK